MLAPNLRDTNLYLFFGRKNIEKILRFQAKILEYSRVGLALTWYAFYFKFPPLKTFTRKTLQLSSEGIIVTRGNSYEKIVPSRCLSSLDSKTLVIAWRPSWMAFNQMFKKTVYAFVWSSAVRACRQPSALPPPVNYFEMRRQRKYFDVTQETSYLRCLTVHDDFRHGKAKKRQTNWNLMYL